MRTCRRLLMLKPSKSPTPPSFGVAASHLKYDNLCEWVLCCQRTRQPQAAPKVSVVKRMNRAIASRQRCSSTRGYFFVNWRRDDRVSNMPTTPPGPWPFSVYTRAHSVSTPSSSSHTPGRRDRSTAVSAPCIRAVTPLMSVESHIPHHQTTKHPHGTHQQVRQQDGGRVQHGDEGEEPRKHVAVPSLIANRVWHKPCGSPQRVRVEHATDDAQRNVEDMQDSAHTATKPDRPQRGLC